jgi:cell division septum initiation protein DivIVA
MSEHGELLSEGGMEWEREVRGYNRQQVDNYVAWRTGQVRELESRLSQSLGEIEHLRQEVADARQSARRPPHEEISERVGQILKLAADEAKSDREQGKTDANELRDAAKAESEKLRADVKHEVDRLKSEAQERAERMLTAAQEQADRAVAAARAEAEEMVSTAHAAAEQTVSEANQHAESTVNAAMAHAKQQLDDATARATAIHDGAERRLNLLISRHTETVRRLTEIRDVVTGLVAGEVSRGSLEDEVNRALGAQQATNGATGSDSRSTTAHEQSPAAPQRSPRQAAPADGRRGVAAQREEPAAPAAPPPTPAPQSAPAAATRQPAAAATRSVHATPVALERDQDDPLTPADQLTPSRYPAAEAPPAGKHVTDAAMQAAEEIRQGRKSDRVLDETAAGTATRSDT